MSLAIIRSRACLGVDAPEVRVEVHLARGLPQFHLVGLPQASVREARERVRSALLNANLEFPDRRLIVNLAPADLPKTGGRFDLAIAMGILVASGQVKSRAVEQTEFIGELALDGGIRGVQGVIAAAIAAGQEQHQLILPRENQAEAALLEQPGMLNAAHLLEVIGHFEGQAELPECQPNPKATNGPAGLCLSEVMGQAQAKRALVIAASGNHHLLMLGPPGTGKSMLAKRLQTLLPPLTRQQALECAAVYSAAGLPRSQQDFYQTCLRAPHHSCSTPALVGGGSIPRPGEISLAHHGVLFLDELTEFQRHTLDALRQPIEDAQVCISRAQQQLIFPARFQLVAAMNPSPCGYYQDGQSRSSDQEIRRYLGKLSGPFLDRFDLSIEVSMPPRGVFNQAESGATSETLRTAVLEARQVQMARAGCLNQALGPAQIKRDCQLDAADKALLEGALESLGLSLRAYHRILRVARTIADLDHSPGVKRCHLLEALGYRAMERLLQKLNPQD